jgi:hypothetical protein
MEFLIYVSAFREMGHRSKVVVKKEDKESESDSEQGTEICILCCFESFITLCPSPLSMLFCPLRTCSRIGVKLNLLRNIERKF